MKIAVDMDDVILDFKGLLKRTVLTEYGVDITERLEEGYWDLHGIIDPIVGQSWWKWLRQRDWLWATADAIPGAIGSLDQLRRQGHYLEILTSKPEWAEPQVWKWLGKWRPPVNQVTIMSTNKGDSKANHSDADLLIDDKVQNCTEWLASGRRALLFAAPWNRSEPPRNGIYRVRDWEEAKGMIKIWAAR